MLIHRSILWNIHLRIQYIRPTHLSQGESVWRIISYYAGREASSCLGWSFFFFLFSFKAFSRKAKGILRPIINLIQIHVLFLLVLAQRMQKQSRYAELEPWFIFIFSSSPVACTFTTYEWQVVSLQLVIQNSFTCHEIASHFYLAWKFACQEHHEVMSKTDDLFVWPELPPGDSTWHPRALVLQGAMNNITNSPFLCFWLFCRLL